MNLHRRRLAQATALTLATGASAWTAGTARAAEPSPFGPLQRADTGVLSIEFADLGPRDGPVAVLLHGWPYDIHTYEAVAPALASQGWRVIVPFLRGHGGTTFRHADTPRNAQQAAVAQDVIDLMDALGVAQAVVAGCDWGARTACIVAALWPQRCRALVSVSGYLVTHRAANRQPLEPAGEFAWWYQYYFATERGALGYARHRAAFARLIWQQASPQWRFGEATFERSARALDNPDHVAIVVHNYRWRLGLAEGEARHDALEARLAPSPPIRVPAITLEGDANGAPHADPRTYAAKFAGPYEHRLLRGGVGHNLPQEAPDAFARAVLDVARG